MGQVESIYSTQQDYNLLFRMKVENKILRKSVDVLAAQTGLLLEVRNLSSKDKGLDYEIEIVAPRNDKNSTIVYLAQVKPNITNATLSNIALLAKRLEERLILITEYVTTGQAEKLRELNIAFFDTAGNAYLNEPGLFVYISGKRTEINREKPLGIFSPAGIKLIFAFLVHPNLENTDYRTIAEDTGIPRTTIGRLIADLEKGGFLIRRGNQRLLTRKPELIQRWVENYSEQFRVKLSPVRFHSTKFTGRWWEEIDIAEYKAVWGGETGGAILTKHLKPQMATIYADSILPRLQAKYGLVRDAKGEIEILRKFWTFGEIGSVAPPLVVYADLLATADDRNLETAQILYDKYLAQIAE